MFVKIVMSIYEIKIKLIYPINVLLLIFKSRFCLLYLNTK